MRLVLLALMLAFVAPRASHAQRIADLNTDASLTTTSASVASPAQRVASPAQANAHKASRWKYILVGTAVGVGAAAIDLSAHKSDDDMIDALAGPPTVAAYAILGAGIGWLVYHIRHGRDGETPE